MASASIPFSIPPGAGSSTSTSNSVSVHVDDEDVQAIDQGFIRFSSGAPELVAMSRISAAFKEYLTMIKGNIVPGIFGTAKWSQDKNFAIVNKKDLEMIWTEVTKLAENYKKETFASKMPYHYFLLSKVLRAKIECVDEVYPTLPQEQAKKKGPKNKMPELLLATRKRLVFEEKMAEEMMERYLELEYLNLKEREGQTGTRTN